MQAKTVVRIEYFIDKAPGIGKGKSVKFAYSPTPNTIDTSFEFDPSGLSAGSHQLFIRYKDTSGLWSPWLMHHFFIEDSNTAQVVDRIEYFIDDETGPGKAKALSITSGGNVNKQFTQSVDSLAGGPHYIHVRSHMNKGLWSPWQMQLFYVDDTVNAGPINKLEYFIDKEPRPGKANPLSITNGDSIKKLFTHSVAGLSSGQHYIHVRNKISSGLWSPWQMQLFFIEDTVNAGPIHKLEYFIDKEPRPGKGNALSITSGDSIKKLFTHSVAGLSGGQHYIHVRNKVSTGLWSPWQMQLFFVDDTVNSGPINKLEYFIDKEPRPGKGNALSITSGDSIKKLFTYSVAGLSGGQHYLHVRNKVSTGLWSPWQMQLFFVDDTVNAGPINKLEYFIDKEPRPGKGNQIQITPADSINKRFSYSLLGLKSGPHYLHVRNKISTGLWSPWQMQLFLITDTIIKNTINAYSYSIDAHLRSIQDTTRVNLNPAVDSFSFIKLHKTDTSLAYGNHKFRIWAQQKTRISSVWHLDTFAIIDCPMLDTAAISFVGGFCKGDTLKFKQNITRLGIWPKDSFNFKWYINGSGTPSSTADSLMHANSNNDSFKLRFVFSKKTDARCKGEMLKTFKLFPSYLLRDTFTLCNGDSLIKHGRKFKTAGTFQSTFNTFKGCDSIYQTKVFVNPSYLFRDTFSICEGDSIVKHGKTFKTAAVYTSNFKSKRSCDSIYLTKIWVNKRYLIKDTIVLCQGDSLIKHGKTFKTAGTFSSNFNTKKGCDSNYITRVIVNPVYRFNDTFVICQGDSLIKHGKTFKSAGLFSARFNTIKSCDSLYFSKIIVKPTYWFYDTAVICSGDSLLRHAKTFKTAGTFISRLSTVGGCDSVYQTHIKVNPSYHLNDSIVLCSGDSVLLHGQTFKLAGVFTNKFMTNKGCDSIYTTKVKVNPSYLKIKTIGLCSGDSILFEKVYRKKTGTYTLKFKSIHGCDSILSLKLTVDSIIKTEESIAICYGDSFLNNGQYVKLAGDYTQTYTAKKGCDSLVLRHLSIRKWDSSYVSASFCFNSSYQFFNQKLTKAGKYQHVLKNRFACDSFILLDLKQRPKVLNTFSGSICFGDSALVGGTYKKGSGIFKDTLIGQFGCDSFIVYTQTERPKSESNLTFSLCPGDSVFVGNSFKKHAGVYQDIVKNRFACDSIIHSNITIKSTSKSTINDTICFGSSYNFFGNLLSNTGVYTKTLNNAQGCDSLITLNLFRRAQFIPKVISINFQTLSADTLYMSYQWYLNRNLIQGANSKTLLVNNPGVYDISVRNFKGCVANSWDGILSLDQSQTQNIKVYPNPNAGTFYIESDVEASFTVYNALGLEVQQGALMEGKQKIQLDNAPDGIYFIYIHTGHSFFNYKLLIIR
jgi:predicted secreted protein